MSYSAGFLVGGFLGAFVITFILASIANRFLRRPLLAGLIAGLLPTAIAYLIGQFRGPTMYVFYWLGAGLSAVILRSRAQRVSAAPAQPH